MRHDYTLSSYGVRLRPVSLDDASFIAQLRTSPEAVGRVGDTRPDVESQKQWIQSYLERPEDYYFIVETLGGKAVGTIGLYDFEGARAEWGRWIIIPGVPAALPSAMGLYELAFRELKVARLIGKVVATNHSVLSFHRRFGMRQVGVEKASRIIQGTAVDMVVFELHKTEWPLVQQRNAALAAVAQRQIS